MKKIILAASLLFFGLTGLFAQEQEVLPEMIFEVTEFDFGTLKKGADCTVDFVFRNTGKADLVITNVKTSCGCTTPTYTQAPVAKKDQGTITVKYDSNRLGSFNKTITVTSNAKNSPIILTIKGQIEDVPAVDNTVKE